MHLITLMDVRMLQIHSFGDTTRLTFSHCAQPEIPDLITDRGKQASLIPQVLEIIIFSYPILFATLFKSAKTYLLSRVLYQYLHKVLSSLLQIVKIYLHIHQLSPGNFRMIQFTDSRKQLARISSALVFVIGSTSALRYIPFLVFCLGCFYALEC